MTYRIPSMEDSLLSRLSSLKSAYNTAITTEESKKVPTPLWVFLYIYSQANHECYINYNEGTQALYKWLSPIASCEHPLLTENFTVPRLLRGYESGEVATILAGCTYGEKHEQAAKEIYVSMTREVLPLLY